jgi:hypothetical protein
VAFYCPKVHLKIIEPNSPDKEVEPLVVWQEHPFSVDENKYQLFRPLPHRREDAASAGGARVNVARVLEASRRKFCVGEAREFPEHRGYFREAETAILTF